MKTLWPVGLFLFATALAVSAQTGFYTTADLGETFPQYASFRGFTFYGRDGYPTPVNLAGSVKFDHGLRLGLTGGYHVTDWLGVEAVSGIMTSKIDSIARDPFPYSINQPSHDAYFSNIPLMVGVRFEWPLAHLALRWR